MCGIVGYVGPQQASPLLLEGLKRLEYRGYDSAGIATLSNGGLHGLPRSRQAREPRREARTAPRARQPRGSATRAGRPTAGPTEVNAHPQTDCTGKIVVVHNGIFENFAERKAALRAAGPHASRARPTPRSSRTRSRPPSTATSSRRCAPRCRQLTGAYAVLVTSSREPGVLVAARSGPPIVLGLGQGENFVASDPVALVPWTRDVIFLEDGDVARVDAAGVRIVDARGRAARARRSTASSGTPSPPRRAATATSWLKEIHEQPTAIAETLGGKVSLETGRALSRLAAALARARREVRPRAAARLRHVLARGPGRQVPDRGHGADAGRGRLRQRVPLPPARSSTTAHAHDRHLAVGRDRRHGGRALGGAPRGLADRRDRQRRPAARSRGWRTPSSRRTRARRSASRRRRPSRRSSPSCSSSPRSSGPRAASPRCLTERSATALAHLPKAVGDGARDRARDRGARPALPARTRLPLPRPRAPLSRGARGRAQAEGDLLHPRRGLPGRAR